MKKINYISKTVFTIMLGSLLFLSSCKDDDESAMDLILEKTTTEVFVDEAVTVPITSGNGDYKASASPETVAKAEISGNSVRISGISKGEATVTVTDGSGKTAAIKVTVNSAIIDATTPRFRWTNTIPLEITNGWATTVEADAVAITNLTDKKQFILSWTGGYAKGDKTGGKLEIVDMKGQDSKVEELTAFEIQAASDGKYSIAFGNASQKGELVFTK